MVECLAVNQNVTGSSPVGGASLFIIFYFVLSFHFLSFHLVFYKK